MVIRPKLKDYKAPEKLSQYPEATCYEAGHLVSTNAGWRNKTPHIEMAQCIGCYQCYIYCPDGVIYKNEGKVAIDYDFCKGCGICRKICPKGAIKWGEGENE